MQGAEQVRPDSPAGVRPLLTGYHHPDSVSDDEAHDDQQDIVAEISSRLAFHPTVSVRPPASALFPRFRLCKDLARRQRNVCLSRAGTPWNGTSVARIVQVGECAGEPCWIRTSDLLIKSQLLYRLS